MRNSWSSAGATFTPWRRWFAWYPVRDRSAFYWLDLIEWRRVCGEKAVIEYRRCDTDPDNIQSGR